ncbi:MULTISPECIES: hypothetical protein [unclassified Crossiella]|uniref:hypothetical protein n=1 Tax=unclassified Crossiella TaxID=2620835 RepID=UPI001FFE9563|nr:MULTISPECIES: hypothetical protein [unclassified Crossiella]MCK2238964.1 hypothetical protein [Crossiella sp. S99.2]MCK2251467.1 hypothetical protein [Crossiella sp. S99.1]
MRHTGVRIEELLEITHLELVSYKLPDTGEIVPMLQVVPSKSNEERLLLVGPELASVLATVITRLRTENGGTVPSPPATTHTNAPPGQRCHTCSNTVAAGAGKSPARTPFRSASRRHWPG